MNNLKKYEDANVMGEIALSLKPDQKTEAYAWYIKSFANFGMKKYEEAYSLMQKAISLDPNPDFNELKQRLLKIMNK